MPPEQLRPVPVNAALENHPLGSTQVYNIQANPTLSSLPGYLQDKGRMNSSVVGHCLLSPGYPG